MKRIVFQVDEALSGARLDKAIAAGGDVSRGLARRALSAGGVFVDGRRVRTAGRLVRAGQSVTVNLEEGGRPEREGGEPPSFPRERILHVDPEIVAVDKPAGLAAQPTLTATDALPARIETALKGRAGLVHRLDRETSGVTVFGRTRKATADLARTFREGRAGKIYLAICAGRPEADAGRWDLPLSPDPAARGRFQVAAGGVPAATRWTVLDAFGEATREGGLSLLRLEPETGRTHQIRVHLAHAGTPILGDVRYGGPAFLTFPDGRRLEPGRFLLHAWRLTVPHPRSGEAVTFEAPVPEDFRGVLAALGASPDGAVAPERPGG